MTNCHQLKMRAADGKNRLTDVADTEQLLRIIQSIPSKNAEPFKAWLALVGRERIEETIDPERAIDRALETYLKKGYSEEWVHQRLLAIRIRNELTDEWKKRGVQKGKEYAILTDEITRAWTGMNTRQYKNPKGLKKENLRDNMSDLELVPTMLAEASPTDIAKAEQPQGFDENQKVARRGGNVAGVARRALEAETGKPVVTAQNAESFRQLVTDIVTDAAQLLASLEQVRRQGYAVEDGEYKIGLRSVSAPIHDVTGEVRYAIGCVGMFRQVQSDEFLRAIRLVCAAAETISRAIGYHG